MAAICIEDKLFPKTSSLIDCEQPLADIAEFTGKIKAAKDTQQDPDFSVVARVEAFIAGKGLTDALKRADAYHESGADAILIHSKSSTPDEALAFVAQWKDTCPVVVAPTTYNSTPTRLLEEAGVSIVIWANHLIRARITAMQRTAARIWEEQSILTIEDEIASFEEVFRMLGLAELRAAEREYLPARGAPSDASAND